jgi:hypothetical protein
MNPRVVACCSVFIVCGGVVSAQRGFPPIDIRGVEPLEFGEVVRGAPFSAEAVTEMTQELRDGNRIERRSTVVIARDGAGRTRREQALPPIGPVVPDTNVRIITISDPRQRILYFIDPQRKTVSRSTTPPSGPPPLPRADQGPGARQLPPPQIASEALGNKQVLGLRAEGTRQTMTVPPGVFGNVGPIDVVTERWYSPELKIVLESRRSDPRTGDVTYRVTSIVRDEPDPALFEIPSDYTVVDRPGPPPRRRPGQF